MKERFDPVTETGREHREHFDTLPEEARHEEVDRAHGEAITLDSIPFLKKAELETNPEQKEALTLAYQVAEAVREENGLALAVGGYARDQVMRNFGYDTASKDIDIEVYGLPFERVLEILKTFGRPDIVGASFGVIKLKGLDISIPRRDSRAGRGHRGFVVEGDPTMTVAEAARRRDFTINAMALNPLTGEIVDPYGGLNDIQEKTLRATDSEAFAEDPLRVLRAMQFAGRFDFHVAPETIALCRDLDLRELSAERIFEEWKKLLTKGIKPSTGLEAARELGVIEQLHPELQTLIGVPQDPEWHPEGDVWTHTKMVTDAAAEIAEREQLAPEEKFVIVLAALCHDLGKPATTEEKNGHIISHAHSEKGEAPTRAFLEAMRAPTELIDRVIPLVRDHLFPSLNPEANDAAVRRLAMRLSPATIQELVMVAESDHHGRTLPWHGYPAGEALLEKAEALKLREQKPKPIIMGRDLIDQGLKPSERFGKILASLFEAQLEGKFQTHDEGRQYLEAYLHEHKD